MLEAWNIDDALKLIGAVQADVLNCGYHITLGGGVLYRGKSDRDLDLYFLPVEGKYSRPKQQDLVDLLQSLWGPYEAIPFDNYGKERPTNPKKERDEEFYGRRGMVPPWDLEEPHGVQARRLAQRPAFNRVDPNEPLVRAVRAQPQFVYQPPRPPEDDDEERAIRLAEEQERIEQDLIQNMRVPNQDAWEDIGRMSGRLPTKGRDTGNSLFSLRIKFSREDGRIDAYIV